jgi:hypothetical protein
MMKTLKIEVFLLKYRVPSLGPLKINHQNKKERKKHLHEKLTFQVKSEQSNLHTKHNLKKKPPPSLTTHQKKRRSPHFITQLLIGFMEILFLKLAAIIFHLD